MAASSSSAAGSSPGAGKWEQGIQDIVSKARETTGAVDRLTNLDMRHQVSELANAILTDVNTRTADISGKKLKKTSPKDLEKIKAQINDYATRILMGEGETTSIRPPSLEGTKAEKLLAKVLKKEIKTRSQRIDSTSTKGEPVGNLKALSRDINKFWKTQLEDAKGLVKDNPVVCQKILSKEKEIINELVQTMRGNPDEIEKHVDALMKFSMDNAQELRRNPNSVKTTDKFRWQALVHSALQEIGKENPGAHIDDRLSTLDPSVQYHLDATSHNIEISDYRR